MGARVWAGDPNRRAVASRHHPVGADSELERHGRAPFCDAQQMAEHDRGGFLGQDALLDPDPGRFETLDPVSVGARVGIAKGNHGARWPCCGDRVGASEPPAALVRAGLERHVEGGAFAPPSGPLERDRFSMGTAAWGRASATEDLARRRHDDGADRWVRPGGAEPAPRKLKRLRHMVLVARAHRR